MQSQEPRATWPSGAFREPENPDSSRIQNQEGRTLGNGAGTKLQFVMAAAAPKAQGPVWPVATLQNSVIPLITLRDSLRKELIGVLNIVLPNFF